MSTFTLEAQISLESCQQKARENYPMIKQFELIQKTEEFNLANANKGYLPQLSLSARASYQSAVTQFPVKMPGVDIPTISKDQYAAEATLEQIIWDGGVIGKHKEQVRSSSEVDKMELESNLYQIRDRVNELYFGILLLDAKLERNRLFEEELERNYKQVRSFLDQGVANRADLDVVRVEILNTMQNRTAINANRNAFIEMLSLFIGEKIDIAESFEIPIEKLTAERSNTEINRPELLMFDAKVSQLDVMKKNINATVTPKFGLFVKGGYGRPGLNMLEDKFKPYYIAGISMSWNFGGFYTKRNDFRKIDIAKKAVDVERETFLFNTQIELKSEDNVITKNRELLKHDDEIISLRTNIRKAAENKLKNGTISTTEFMREVTAEDMAKQQKIEHEMELLMSIYKQKYITNN